MQVSVTARCFDNWNKVEYRYDDKGIRIVKKGNTGEVVYANQNYTVRGGEIISKHVFAGNTRLASKLVYKKKGIEEDKGTYYYHGDHLGSSNFVSNKTGGFHEHTEYFTENQPGEEIFPTSRMIKLRSSSKSLKLPFHSITRSSSAFMNWLCGP